MHTTDVSSIGKLFKPLAMISGLVYFISLLICDAYKAIRGKPARIWIPGKSLVISALTIQILSYLEIYLVKGNHAQSVFVGESERVVTCVLIGYFLPEMARAGAWTDWHTLSALILALFTSEFNYLIYALNEGIVGSKYYLYRLVTNVVLAMSIILMVLFSICTILAGRTIRGMLAQKISVVQWDKSQKQEEKRWEKFENVIMESWLLARVCNPQYVIARSVLISAVGVVVTTCIFFLAILHLCLFWIDEGYLNYKFGISMTAWALETAFILMGEAVICCRWITAVVYFPRFFVQKKKQYTHPRPFVEDFWTRSVSDLIEMYNLAKWCQQEQLKHGRLEGLVLRLATTLKIHYLFYLLKPVQILLICFCKCCFFISELVFRYKFVWYYLRGSDKGMFQPRRESEEYKEILTKVCMPGENWESLWIANEKTMKQAKDHFSKNIERGSKFDELFKFISPHLEPSGDGRFINELKSISLVAKHFPALDENCMRMTALSLLNVIVNLSLSREDVGKVEKAIEAYKQSWDLMSFVDNSDPQRPTTINMFEVMDNEADRVGVAVYKEFQILLVGLNRKKRSSKRFPDSASPSPEASETIKRLRKKAEKKLTARGFPITEKEKQTDGEEEQPILETYCDSRDWSAIAANYSKYRVCEHILIRDKWDEDELMNYLYSSLSDVIVHCLLKLPDVMVKTCRNWAVEFEEQKIWDAMYTAGKFVGVMKKRDLEAKANFLQPYKDTENKETHTDVLMNGSTSSTIPTTTCPITSSSKGTSSVVEMTTPFLIHRTKERSPCVDNKGLGTSIAGGNHHLQKCHSTEKQRHKPSLGPCTTTSKEAQI